MISPVRHADHRRSHTLGWIVLGGAIAGLCAATVTAVITYARLVVMPSRTRGDDLRIIDIDQSAGTITLTATVDTRAHGNYSLWFSESHGHAKVGAIVAETETTVTRTLLGVDFGDLAGSRTARLGGWVYLSPRDLGVTAQNVSVQSDVGACPAWLIPASAPANSSQSISRWVIQVHGRGGQRSETLRAVPVFHQAGYTALLVSWRNDGHAPPSADGRYGLGGTEWRDVEAAIRFAVQRGATDIVLMGWSMGGAIALQALDRSAFSDRLRGVVLESPVVDWLPTLEQRGAELGLPRRMTHVPLAVLAGRAHGVSGTAEPIDFAALDWVCRAEELSVPILLQHSANDGYVPATASRLLAAKRPDIVTYHEWTRARHARLWNYDAARFDREISSWLGSLDLESEPDPEPAPAPAAS